MNLKELGQKIQMAREEKNMSQEELAQAIGCSQSALSNYEKGKRHIYLAQLEKLSSALEKPLDYFVERNLAENHENQTPVVVNSAHNGQFIALMNEIYKLSDKNIYEVTKYVEYLNWKQSKGE